MDTDLITNKYNTDYPETTRMTYSFLQQFHKYTARVSMIWKLLLDAYQLKEYEAMDYEMIQNGSIISWLIDRQIDWQEGRDVNFSEVYRALQEAGEFTSSEKLLFESGNIEERLWAIFLIVTSPELELT